MTEPAATPDLSVPVPNIHFNAWRVLVAASLAGITLSWLAPFYLTLVQGGLGAGALPVVTALAFVLCLAYGADLAVEALRLRSNVRIIVQIAVLFGAGLLALYLMVWSAPGYGTDSVESFIVLPEIVGFLAILVAWWRGQTLFQHQIGTIRIRKAFRYGIWLHLATGLIRYQISGQLNPTPFYLFLFVSLIGMGCARLATVGSLRGGSGVPFDRSLITGMGGSAAGLILASSMVALLAEGPVAGLVRRILSGVLSALAEVVFFLLQPVIRWIIELLERLGGAEAGLLPADDNFNPIAIGDTVQQALADLSEEITPPTWAADLGQIVKVGLIAFGIILAVVILYAGLRQWRTLGSLNLRDDRESLISWSDLPRILLQSLRQRIQRVADGFQQLRPAERRYAAARIRRIYAELLDLCGQMDLARPAALTPLEFLPTLQSRFDTEDEALALITRSYLKVRYGELPETRQQVEAVETAWRRVGARGAQILREVHGRFGLS